mmetsp:Transcript_68677/g.134920  ORF Transcript_68677/g.134920 Transcript_68677/m.134920 type:complete len:112 (+) Transcript_68677:679-1014(+)
MRGVKCFARNHDNKDALWERRPTQVSFQRRLAHFVVALKLLPAPTAAAAALDTRGAAAAAAAGAGAEAAARTTWRRQEVVLRELSRVAWAYTKHPQINRQHLGRFLSQPPA